MKDKEFLESDKTWLKGGTNIEKGWGINKVGEIFAYHVPNEQQPIDVQTVKILYIAKNKQLSLHFHSKKKEIFICAWGKIKVEYILKDATHREKFLVKGDRMIIPQNLPHKIIGIDDLNILIEVSTVDIPDDSYRIIKGD